MTLRDNTRILAAAQAQGLSVATNAKGDTVVAKGREQILIRALQDGPGQPFAYDYLRVAEGGTWRVSTKEALDLVASGMTATHLGNASAATAGRRGPTAPLPIVSKATPPRRRGRRRGPTNGKPRSRLG